MANQKIKDHAKKRNVFLWELAKKYGVTDSNFSRRLRCEFSPEEQKKALQYIDEIAAERG